MTKQQTPDFHSTFSEVKDCWLNPALWTGCDEARSTYLTAWTAFSNVVPASFPASIAFIGLFEQTTAYLQDVDINSLYKLHFTL